MYLTKRETLTSILILLDEIRISHFHQIVNDYIGYCILGVQALVVSRDGICAVVEIHRCRAEVVVVGVVQHAVSLSGPFILLCLGQEVAVIGEHSHAVRFCRLRVLSRVDLLNELLDRVASSLLIFWLNWVRDVGMFHIGPSVLFGESIDSESAIFFVHFVSTCGSS